jgi:hypothetical protein
MSYRNITCNVTRPRSNRDHCARAILDTLAAAGGGAVLAGDLDRSIRAAGAQIRFKVEAVKALRNIGHPVIAHKARHLSWYKLGGTPTEFEDHRQYVVKEAYSRQVSICRELAGIVAAMPNDPALAASYTHSQMTAMSLGTDPAVGMTIPQVMTDLAVLTP